MGKLWCMRLASARVARARVTQRHKGHQHARGRQNPSVLDFAAAMAHGGDQPVLHSTRSPKQKDPRLLPPGSGPTGTLEPRRAETPKRINLPTTAGKAGNTCSPNCTPYDKHGRTGAPRLGNRSALRQTVLSCQPPSPQSGRTGRMQIMAMRRVLLLSSLGARPPVVCQRMAPNPAQAGHRSPAAGGCPSEVLAMSACGPSRSTTSGSSRRPRHSVSVDQKRPYELAWGVVQVLDKDEKTHLVHYAPVRAANAAAPNSLHLRSILSADR